MVLKEYLQEVLENDCVIQPKLWILLITGAQGKVLFTFECLLE